MRFEVFDREQTTAAREDLAGLVVQVDRVGRLLFSRAVWGFLLEQFRWEAGDTAGGGLEPAEPLEVALLFDVESRTAAVRALAGKEPESTPLGARWRTVVMRSHEWPRGVNGRAFCEHYQVGADYYRARLVRGPGPRLVTFEVGNPARLPELQPVERERLLAEAEPVVVGAVVAAVAAAERRGRR